MYRKKLMAFCYGACIIIIFSYAFAFRKTIIVRKGLLQLRDRVEVINHSEELRDELVLKLTTLDNQLGTIQVSGDNQEFILSTIHKSKDIQSVRIIEVPGTTNETEGDIARITYGVTLEGNFKDLVKTIRTFEISGSKGEIASLKFYRYTDTKSKSTSTRLKFYIQEFKAI